VVIVATNHSSFEGPEVLREILARAAEDCLLVDPWNALGIADVFSDAAGATSVLGAADPVDSTRDSAR
jgi:UDP-N-acetyl-D-mannosaminuronic acid dehydrogenase